MNEFGNIKPTVTQFYATHIAVRAAKPAGQLPLCDTGLGPHVYESGHDPAVSRCPKLFRQTCAVPKSEPAHIALA